MRNFEKRLASLETEAHVDRCTCREPMILLRLTGEDDWLASLTPAQQEALERSCPVHPEQPQCWIVRISSGEPLDSPTENVC